MTSCTPAQDFREAVSGIANWIYMIAIVDFGFEKESLVGDSEYYPP